jgi:hypothetical protein
VTTRTFSVGQLEEEIRVTWGVGPSSPLVVLSEPMDKHRWYTVVRVVFKHEDQLWEIFYNDPATEMQEDMDHFDIEPVMATLVEAFEKTVVDYRAVTP